ncbi:uncharacterized protein LOC143298676 [Babylonia areolata]|uniref:uncharacterized protein LOC143298676 n=1 Tax=Babylonia areolata TaxID=304850 RepID=UPI003FD67C63
MDIQNDFPTKHLMTSLASEDTWSDKTKARDVLMTLLTVGSISRLGAIRNMTMEQLDTANTVEEDENLYRIDHRESPAEVQNAISEAMSTASSYTRRSVLGKHITALCTRI